MEVFVVIFGVLLFILISLTFLIVCFNQSKESECEDTADSRSVSIDSTSANRMQRARVRSRVQTNQQEDIFNISSRVQGQGQWPTHDAHVSLDHFAITNEINKYNDDPPTYEEAMNIAASNNNNTVVPAVVPKTTITPSSTTTTTTTTSTSTSAAN
ncbi:uncharacterized protein LOC135134590 isoform X4 [Zophobas morio]|uniref:uncharacterized protein LOC135134590 isoform X4 n=1 Tax=Zophobas morio TaxID=2755281 RepID=UPI0030828656